MIYRIRGDEGFTLIEVMAVIAIIGILAAIAMGSYRQFTDKAKAVEAEVALAEVNRLEMIHRANNGAYSDNLNTIGFSLNPALKYYQVAVQVQNGGTAFQATALPLGRSGQATALVLTHSPDGQIGIMKADPAALAAQKGGIAGGNGNSRPDPVGPGTVSTGTGGNTIKPSCRQGGDATLAEDGLLDMNFCLK